MRPYGAKLAAHQKFEEGYFQLRQDLSSPATIYFEQQ